jgi:hypothetical protein
VRTLRSLDIARASAAIGTVSRRLRRFAFRYDALEHRQLLSVGQAVAKAGAPLNPVVQPSVAAAPLYESMGPSGLSPSQVASAYGVNQINFGGVTGNGAGQTIAIVDAYYDPDIASDLQAFDSQYGLQAPASFTQYVENGLNQINSSWALETALDVEWAHAIAPGASIDLIEAQPTLTDLLSAVSYASSLPGVSVVSMSWGTGEFSGESAYDSTFTTPTGHNGVTFVAASGDTGTTQYPAASPNVLSVGGTTLSVTSQGTYISETPWSSTGTGTSPYEPQPTWQAAAASAAGLSSSGRTTPDVSFDANPSTGVSVYDSIPYPGAGRSNWYTVGGTSVIADQGLALSGVGSLSNAQASLYQIASSNFNHPTATGTSSTGYALTTGLGTPKANLLISALVQQNTTATTQTHSTVSTTGSTVTVVGHANDVVAAPTAPPTTTTTTATTTSISALTPTSTVVSPTLSTVYIVPAPTPPVLHLGSSSAPVVAEFIVNNSYAQQAEMPTSLTHFGQALETELQRAFKPQLGPKSDGSALIDVVAPFQPMDAADEPRKGSTLDSGILGGWPSDSLTPFAVDTAIEAANGGLFPLASLELLRRMRKGLKEARPWEFSTIFGAAVVAVGGYHVAMRESMRFKTRWLPGRAASNLGTGRWPGFRGR